MKRVIVALTIGVFLLIIFKYIIDNISPFNAIEVQKLIEVNQIRTGDWDTLNKVINDLISKGEIFKYLSLYAYLAVIVFCVGIGSIFTAIHLTIDKIFFKNFFESASLFDAIRRSMLLSVGLVALIYLKLLGVETYVLILTPIVLLALEIVFTLYFRKPLLNRIESILRIHKEVKAEIDNKGQRPEIRDQRSDVRRQKTDSV